MLTDTKSISDARFEDCCSQTMTAVHMMSRAEAQQIPHQPSKGLFSLHH